MADYPPPEVEDVSDTEDDRQEQSTVVVHGGNQRAASPGNNTNPTLAVWALKKYASLLGWTSWLGKRGGEVAWVVGTTTLILVFPLWLEAEREAELIRGEQEQMKMFASQGYTPMQLQNMQQSGALGVPPPPPPLTAQFR